MSSLSFLSELECPVCLLPPRQAPVFMCPLGHNICCECKPLLKKCPICKVNYLQKKDTRNFFVEKILDSLERKCRYELFGCKYSVCDSKELVDHEKLCIKKPEVNNNTMKPEESDGENAEEDAAENEFNDPMFLNLVYFYDIRPLFHYYAYTLVFLRMFIFEFSDLNRHPGVWFELSLLWCLFIWLTARRTKLVQFFLEVYQPDEFETQFQLLRKHLRNILYQDAKEIYLSLVLWVALVISGFVYLKLNFIYTIQSELESTRFEALLFFLKPSLTFVTSLVCIAWHLFFKWGKLDRWVAAFGIFRLLWLSFNLAYVELTLNAGSLIDEGFCLIFWIQTVSVLLPFGKVSFILLELFGFLSMTYNAYDTLLLDGIGKHDFLDVFLRAFNGNHFKLQLMLKDLSGSMEVLENGFSAIMDNEPLAPDVAKELSKFVDKYRTDL